MFILNAYSNDSPKHSTEELIKRFNQLLTEELNKEIKLNDYTKRTK